MRRYCGEAPVRRSSIRGCRDIVLDTAIYQRVLAWYESSEWSYGGLPYSERAMNMAAVEWCSRERCEAAQDSTVDVTVNRGRCCRLQYVRTNTWGFERDRALLQYS